MEQYRQRRRQARQQLLAAARPAERHVGGRVERQDRAPAVTRRRARESMDQRHQRKQQQHEEAEVDEMEDLWRLAAQAPHHQK